jgi:hypothetical protein
MLRGINKQDIFEEDEDYVRMKEILIRLNVGDYPWSSWREYADVPVLCDTRTVLNRSSLEDLTALVNVCQGTVP